MIRRTRPRTEAMAPSTTTIHSTIPQAIITSILSKLPVKPLVRFKCISKSLHSLIETSGFISKHLCRSTQNPLLLVRYYCHIPGLDTGLALIVDEKILYDVEMPSFLIGLPCFPRVVDSCNGLICVDVSRCFASALVLWNITTRQFKHLPKPLFVESPSLPPLGMVSPGFGYNPDTDDYMVVRIVYFINLDCYESRAEVYKRSTGYWKEIRTDIFRSMVVYGGQEAVAVKGVLHWMANGIEELANNMFIVSFDMNQEAFRMITMPKTFSESYIKAITYEGSLALAVYPEIRSSGSRFELWVLNDDGKLWSQQINIALFPRAICPMGSWKDRQLIMKSNREILLVQSPMEIEGRKIPRLPLCAAEYTFKFYTFVESLVSVHGEKEKLTKAVDNFWEIN